MKSIRSAPHSVIFFGDSLTEGWDLGIWQQQLAPRGLLNAGIAGDRTDHLLWRLEHGNLAGRPPKAVVLLIGTNDLGSGRSPEATADGISANLALLRSRLPTPSILLLGLLPREQKPSAALRRAVARVNAVDSQLRRRRAHILCRDRQCAAGRQRAARCRDFARPLAFQRARLCAARRTARAGIGPSRCHPALEPGSERRHCAPTGYPSAPRKRGSRNQRCGPTALDSRFRRNDDNLPRNTRFIPGQSLHRRDWSSLCGPPEGHVLSALKWQRKSA